MYILECCDDIFYSQVYIAECVGVHVVGYVFIVYGAASAVSAVIVGKMLGTVSITLLSLLNLCLSVGLVAFLLIWEREPNYPVMFTVAILWGICDSNWITLTSSKYYCGICSIIGSYILYSKTLAINFGGEFGQLQQSTQLFAIFTVSIASWCIKAWDIN